MVVQINSINFFIHRLEKLQSLETAGILDTKWLVLFTELWPLRII